jgi:hypothetical protein
MGNAPGVFVGGWVGVFCDRGCREFKAGTQFMIACLPLDVHRIVVAFLPLDVHHSMNAC